MSGIFRVLALTVLAVTLTASAPAGTCVEETIIQVWGMGPATSTPAGKR